MAFEFQSFAVLQVIGSKPEAFKELKMELVKVVPALVEKQFKAIGSDLKRARAIYQALGRDLFEEVAEAMDAKKVIGFLKSLDKHNPELKANPTPIWAAGHLLALMGGEIEPVEMPSKVTPIRKAKQAASKGRPMSNADLVATGNLLAMGGRGAGR
jgi:hypothetical protein